MKRAPMTVVRQHPPASWEPLLAGYECAVKSALVEQGVLAHATTSAVLSEPDDELRAHVIRVIARAWGLEAP